MATPRRSLAYGLTANVVILGLVSLFTDISSEMILPILPFFLIQVLGANALIVGIEEGFSDSVVSFMKILSGRFSDIAGKRKRFVGAGYALSTVMKTLFPFARSWPEFIGLRIVERTGKGVRDAPRDALLTESTPPETRGKAFGLHRSMGTAGAIAGPIVTLVLLGTVLASLNVADQYRSVLLLAAIPAALSVLIVLFVHEPTRAPAPRHPLRVTFRGIPRPLLTFIAIAGLFSFADFSYAFLLLRAGQSNGTVIVILLYVRVGRKPVVLVGYVAFIAMTTLLVFSDALAVLVVAFILYGLEYGMAEGTQRALVADFAPSDIKATVLGAYHTSVGTVKLASGLVAGFLWVAVAPTATFAFGAVTATFAAIALSLWNPGAKS